MLRTIAAIAGKDLTLLFRDPLGAFFAFGFPLLFAIFFGSMFGGSGSGSKPIAIAVCDLDQTPASKKFADLLAGASELRVEFADIDTARDWVRKGQKAAYVAIPKGFGDRQDVLFAGEPPELEVGIDPSRQAEIGMLRGILTQYSFMLMQETMADPDKMRKQAQLGRTALQGDSTLSPDRRNALDQFFKSMDEMFATVPKNSPGTTGTQTQAADSPMAGFQPMKLTVADVSRATEGRPRSAFHISFAQGMVWAMIGCATAFGVTFIIERNQGTLFRLRVAPLNIAELLAGKAMACFVATVTVSSFLALVGYFVFGVVPDSVPLLALAIVCAGVAFVGIMMLLSLLGKTEASASGIGWAVLLVMSMIGGGMIPQQFMPAWMDGVGHASPVYWAIRAFEGALWRGFSIGEMLLPCGILLAVGIVGFSIGAKLFRWNS